MKVIEMKGNLGGFTLLKGRVPEGYCPECIVKHDPSEPHNLQSMHYQMAFKEQHGRFPTWHDAMRHCDAKLKALWLDELAAHGVIVGPDEHAPKPVKERPILFSGPMVRAIFDGRKTQTRRICKARTQAQADILGSALMDDMMGEDDGTHEGAMWKRFPCPYGVPGDRLWVRESHRYDGLDPKIAKQMRDPATVQYRADGDDECVKWLPSIHMPHWASRITLEIVSVRVERLRDITEADARAEGCCGVSSTQFGVPNFKHVWVSINGPGSWTANPWVWVVEFKRVESEVCA